jgi:tripartite-type tricarboxylate transporter receptor subunit TctC
MIIPVAAGGSTDIVGRVVAERMRASLGQPVVVENVTGAGGTTAVTRLHRSAPDGYTMIVGQWSSHVGGPLIYAPPFDYLTDFEPVARLSIGAIWVMGRKDFPAKDAKELVAWLKANPGKASAGTVGPGSGAHLCMVYLANTIGSSVQFVPYRGGAPAMQDVASGAIDLACLEAGQTLSLTNSGMIKPYAALTEKRWFKAPDVPTFDEAGVPGLQFPFWHALWAPKGTPKPGDRDDVHGNLALREEAAGGVRVGGGDAKAGELLDRLVRGVGRDGGGEAALAIAEGSQPRQLGAGLDEEVDAGDAEVGDAIADELDHVVRTHEEHVEVEVADARDEAPIVLVEDQARVVQQREGRLDKAALVRDRKTKAVSHASDRTG